MNRYALPLTLSALLITPHVACADETKQAVFAARVDDTHGSVDSAMGHYADARVHHRSRNGRVAVFVAEDVNRGGPVRRLADVGQRGLGVYRLEFELRVERPAFPPGDPAIRKAVLEAMQRETERRALALRDDALNMFTSPSADLMRPVIVTQALNHGPLLEAPDATVGTAFVEVLFLAPDWLEPFDTSRLFTAEVERPSLVRVAVVPPQEAIADETKPETKPQVKPETKPHAEAPAPKKPSRGIIQVLPGGGSGGGR